jgi:CheY-like chemotaxis protein
LLVELASGLRVLLIDDEPLSTSSLRAVLEAEGHLVTPANGAQEGIELWTAARSNGSPFAVVITDLGMPDVDGRKVATSVKAASPATPIVLLTGWGHQLHAF